MNENDLNGVISRTRLAFGKFMNSEFVKNCNRRRASRFLGTFAADSFMVKSWYNLRICALYIAKERIIHFINNSTFENISLCKHKRFYTLNPYNCMRK